MRPLKLLLSQQTGLAVQPLEPVPMTEMGVQVMPTRTSKLSRTMPRRPSNAVALELLAGSTVLQHWREPVSHSLAGSVEVLAGAVTVTVVLVAAGEVVSQGIAAAKTAALRTTAEEN